MKGHGMMSEEQGAEPISLSVTGEAIALGPLRDELIPLLARWLDPETNRTMEISMLPWTTQRLQTWFDRAVVADDECWFVAYERAGLRPIGVTGLDHLDFRDRTGEYNLVVGEKDARGKGYGTEITRLVLDYAFTVLGLHNVWLRVYEYNPAAIRAYEKAGFVPIGRRHQCKLMGGKLWDVLMMECLSSTFESPVLGRIYRPDLQT
jgi:diamine N-acetyltransferase